MGDRYNMSGDFRGSIINIKSTLTNVQQSVGDIHSGDDSDREELQKLIGELNEALQKVPESHAEDAVAIAQSTESMVEQAKTERPNRTMLRITGQGLKEAAANLAEVMPAVVTIASQIVMTIGRLTGAMS